MKKAIISIFALSLFALPMSLQANPPAKEDGDKAKPMSAMKSTIASPSKAADKAAKGSETAQEKADAAKKAAEEAAKDEAKK